ncbi:hypothetical protein F0562_019614 [Nyssa sinensis]|uniref:MADS-box domain-containing protein n=1 Tax=Nyssa sinensis TaxID=561372 RepID=A0A5J5BRY6_9ASTE|nr:hypothetical protein F0562_019614 [Nyssa sinensis]
MKVSTMASAQKNKEKKVSKGRQKIEIKKIDNKESLQVTFSKRRSGLFRKASELSILSGAEIAIIVLSPKDKVFTFGYPNPDAVINRYLTLTEGSHPEQPRGDNTKMHDYNQHYSEVVKLLEAEKNRGEKIEEEAKAVTGCGSGGFWWDEVDVDGMELEELERYEESLEELKKKVEMRVCQCASQNSAMDQSKVANSAVVPHGFNFGHGNF